MPTIAPPIRGRIGRRTALAGLAALVPALLGACAASLPRSSGPLGFDRAPAVLDPASPTLSAANVAFDRTDLRVPAGRAFVLVVQNREPLVHNVSIYRDAAFTERVFEGVAFEGPGTRWYPVPALGFGTTYFFQCDVHPIPSMQGTLTPGL